MKISVSAFSHIRLSTWPMTFVAIKKTVNEDRDDSNVKCSRVMHDLRNIVYNTISIDLLREGFASKL